MGIKLKDLKDNRRPLEENVARGIECQRFGSNAKDSALLHHAVNVQVCITALGNLHDFGNGITVIVRKLVRRDDQRRVECDQGVGCIKIAHDVRRHHDTREDDLTRFASRALRSGSSLQALRPRRPLNAWRTRRPLRP